MRLFGAVHQVDKGAYFLYMRMDSKQDEIHS